MSLQLRRLTPARKELAMSWSDPQSKESLKALADREKDGGHLSRNERFELDRARRYGVKDTKGQKI